MKIALSIFLTVLFFSIYVPVSSGATIANDDPSNLKTLRIVIKDESLSDETIIGFKRGFKDTYETMDGDAPYMTGSEISISTLTADKQAMAINFMPEMSAVKEIKLNVDAKASKKAVLAIPDLPSNEYYFILHDKYLNTYKVLTKNFSYKFNIDKKLKNSYGTERFSLLVKPVSIVEAPEEPSPAENLNSKISIYPNPASQVLNIALANDTKQASTFIYNLSGQLVKSTTVAQNAGEINIAGLPQGSYVIVLKDSKTEEKLTVSKFIKE